MDVNRFRPSWGEQKVQKVPLPLAVSDENADSHDLGLEEPKEHNRRQPDAANRENLLTQAKDIEAVLRVLSEQKRPGLPMEKAKQAGPRNPHRQQPPG